MKIEIGESIVYSWLRHIKKCQIVQSNWKTSPEWTQASSNGDLQAIMDRANIEFNNPFKKTKHLSQLFRQAEIDALGINIQENTIYAVDIAFHEGGLSYGDKFETAKRITKKIIRTILILQQHFRDITNHKVIFISPKINPEPLSVLESEISRISKFLAKESIPCNIKLISNTGFKDEILDPITHLSKNVADTSELFLRSIQLVNLFQPVENTTQKRTIIRTKPPRKGTNSRTQNNAEITYEINKVNKRILGWFKSPEHINSTILIGYLELTEEHKNITEQMIKNKCHTISDFKGNFSQMKNFGEKNHGKVFEEKFGAVSLWEPVKQFILEQYNIYKNV